jgi:hypothetical protein
MDAAKTDKTEKTVLYSNTVIYEGNIVRATLHKSMLQWNEDPSSSKHEFRPYP